MITSFKDTSQYPLNISPEWAPYDRWKIVGIRYERCLGFGYDSYTDDYKVVIAICKGSDRALVHILSLKSNNCKRFGQVDYRFDDAVLATPGILFNGALHWFRFDANYTSDKLSTSAEYIRSRIFVQTLVSPYVNNGRPIHATNNYSTVKAGNVKEKRETEEEEGIRTIQRINI
ncbi:hypothetical protein Tco_0683857 [Tanacetum coccineum]